MKWWAEYDTDGTAEIYSADDGVDPSPWVCQLGPFDTLTQARRELLDALRDCKRDIMAGIGYARRVKRDRLKHVKGSES